PAVLEWDWTLPMSAATHSCLLVLASCTMDPVGVQSLAVNTLVTQNRQIGLKNLFIIDMLSSPYLATIRLYPSAATDTFRFSALPKGWSLRLVLPKKALSKITHTGLEAKSIHAAERARITEQLGKQAAFYDLKQALLANSPGKGCEILGVPMGMQ